VRYFYIRRPQIERPFRQVDYRAHHRHDGARPPGKERALQALIEREQMRQSLYLAQEVQQTLLPRENPKVDGLDIAATIVYCDETGNHCLL
jgi:hypothetical protein